MGKIAVHEFMTLDGVIEAPGFEEHRDGKNAWALSTATEDQQRFKVDEVFAAGAILLGRVTYQIWATFWPDAPKDAGLADRVNALEKYVVSTTLREPTWNNKMPPGTKPLRQFSTICGTFLPIPPSESTVHNASYL